MIVYFIFGFSYSKIIRKTLKALIVLILYCTRAISNDVATVTPDPSTTPPLGDDNWPELLGLPLNILVATSVTGIVVCTTIILCFILTAAYLRKRKKGRAENGSREPSDSASSYDSDSS